MPLASWATLAYYGPAAGAAVVQASGSTTAGIKGYASGESTVGGVGSVVNADATRLVNSPATIVGTGSIVTALPKGRGRLSSTIKVNTLSQDDVSGAVLDNLVEAGITVKEALRILLAVAVGKTDIDTSGPDPIVTFRDTNDTKDRVTATMAGSERTTVTLDKTP